MHSKEWAVIDKEEQRILDELTRLYISQVVTYTLHSDGHMERIVHWTDEAAKLRDSLQELLGQLRQVRIKEATARRRTW